MTQRVRRTQHGPTYNGPIYLYKLSVLNYRAQQTFSRAYALLGPAVDTTLVAGNDSKASNAICVYMDAKTVHPILQL